MCLRQRTRVANRLPTAMVVDPAWSRCARFFGPANVYTLRRGRNCNAKAEIDAD
jgi:hypothetical protein